MKSLLKALVLAYIDVTEMLKHYAEHCKLSESETDLCTPQKYDINADCLIDDTMLQQNKTQIVKDIRRGEILKFCQCLWFLLLTIQQNITTTN